MADNTALEWTKFAVSVVGGTIAVGVGLYQYVTTSTQTARQPFLQKQTELCFKASETVARLATTDDPAQWKTSLGDFWMLYWGPLAVVEDKYPVKTTKYSIVESRMVEFGDKIKELKDATNHLPHDELTRAAINVSKACQDLTTAWWNIGLLGVPGPEMIPKESGAAPSPK